MINYFIKIIWSKPMWKIKDFLNFNVKIFLEKEGSLEELINEKNHYKQVIDPNLQKKWSLQMLNGLEFLHDRLHVIHRDIKPG